MLVTLHPKGTPDDLQLNSYNFDYSVLASESICVYLRTSVYNSIIMARE